jgi:signal transduction histidine kinase
LSEIVQKMEADSLKFSVPKRQPLTQLAMVVTVINLAMVLAGTAMVVASFTANREFINLSAHIYPFPFIAIVFSIFGLLILNSHPKNTVGWLILIVAFWAGLHFLVNGYMAFDEDVIVGNPDTALHIAILLNHIVWWPVQVIPLTLILLYFPDGKLLSPRWRIVAISTVLGLVLGMLTGFHPGPVPEWGITEPNPAGIKGSEQFLERLGMVYPVPLFIGAFGSIAAAIIKFRRAIGVERVQMKWLVYGAAVGISLSSALFVYYLFTPGDPTSIRLTYFIPTLLTFIIPVTCGIAIIRHGLWDIDVIINHSLVYASLTALIIAIYIVIVGGLGTMFQTQTNVLSGLVAAGIIAMLFQPLRVRLQLGVNRLLYGERDDPAAVLTRLAHHLETADTPAAILPNLVQTIAHTLKIPHVAIWLPISGKQFEPVAAWGESPGHVEMIPLIYQKETIGHLIVAPRGPHESFNRSEQQLLHTIAALTANTVRAVQLSDELRRSRHRIVTAREDERRRLRRDLHDGLGPQLASQSLGLEAVAQLFPANPEKAQALLNTLKMQAQEAMLDVRRLVYDLRPPALDDLGLIGALQQSASRYQTGVLSFSFDVPAKLPDLPAAVETAVYRIAQEAMTNVLHHAQATLCTVRLFCKDAHLIVEVRDNGTGLSQNHPSGVGLQAMEERTTELNGQFQLESQPGSGTLVRSRLPLEVDDE